LENAGTSGFASDCFFGATDDASHSDL
jgi:hypothetical protein